MYLELNPSLTINKNELLQIKMHDISTINFDLLANTIQEELSFLQDATAEEKRALTSGLVTKFCASNNLINAAYWFLPQLLAEIGSWKVSPNFSGLETVKLNCNTSRNKGIWYLCMHSNRGDFVKSQYQEPGNLYCRLVPLILAAFKKYQDIPYSKWTETEYIVESELHKAMVCEVPDLSPDELLRVRTDSLVIKTGKQAGKSRSPMSCFKLYGVSDPRIKELPSLAQLMVTQMWCAHPASRNKYMVLDPRDWDKMPEVLINTEVLIK